jgi:hypothetical protein
MGVLHASVAESKENAASSPTAQILSRAGVYGIAAGSTRNLNAAVLGASATGGYSPGRGFGASHGGQPHGLFGKKVSLVS